MTNEQKQIIADEIAKRFPKNSKTGRSQNKAAKITGVSSATISHMVSGKWQDIADSLWQKVAIKLNIQFEWNTAETKPFKYLYRHLEGAQITTQAFMVSTKAGAGKSETYKNYAKNHHNVIYVEYATYWKTKRFVQALCNAAGLDDEGTQDQMIDRFVDHVCGLVKPLIIVDQFDKMKDTTADLFIDMHNLLPNSAFCLSGTPALEKKMRRGVNNNRTGYHEIWSRVHEKCLKMPLMDFEDVKKICEVNYLDDIEEITEIFNDAKGDGRIIKKSIKTYFLNNGSK